MVVEYLRRFPYVPSQLTISDVLRNIVGKQLNVRAEYSTLMRNEWIIAAPSNKEKFAIEDFAKSVTAAEFTYRGHSYIWFHHPGGWDGIVHNPDCKCSKK